MPFQDPASSVIISALGEGWRVQDEQTTEVAEGWDTMKLVQLKDYGNTYVTADQVAAEFPKGYQPYLGTAGAGQRYFWVTGCKPKRLVANVWSVEIDLSGTVAGPDIPKIRVETSSDSRRVQGLLYSLANTNTQIPAEFDILRAVPILTAQYVRTFGGVGSSVNRVGRWGAGFQTPPIPLNLSTSNSFAGAVNIPGFGAALYPSTTVNRLTVNIPSGWYFSGLSSDVLTGTEDYGTVRLETETWLWRPVFNIES